MRRLETLRWGISVCQVSSISHRYFFWNSFGNSFDGSSAFRLECHFYHMHLVLLFMTIPGGYFGTATRSRMKQISPNQAMKCHLLVRQDWPGKIELQTAGFSINISDKLNQLATIVTRSWSLDWKSCQRFSDGCGRWNFWTHIQRKAEVESVFPDLIVDASSGNSSHPDNSIVQQFNCFFGHGSHWEG